MPLYDFHCKECNCDFELLVRGSTAYVCPECGSAEVEKQVSLPASPGKTKEIIARAMEARMALHDLSEELPAGLETVMDVAQQTVIAFQSLDAARKKLAAATS